MLSLVHGFNMPLPESPGQQKTSTAAGGALQRTGAQICNLGRTVVGLLPSLLQPEGGREGAFPLTMQKKWKDSVTYEGKGQVMNTT